MKKFFLALMIAGATLSVASSAHAGWRHLNYWDAFLQKIYLIHPNGDRWYWTCGDKHCGFRKG